MADDQIDPSVDLNTSFTADNKPLKPEDIPSIPGVSPAQGFAPSDKGITAEESLREYNPSLGDVIKGAYYQGIFNPEQNVTQWASNNSFIKSLSSTGTLYKSEDAYKQSSYYRKELWDKYKDVGISEGQAKYASQQLDTQKYYQQIMSNATPFQAYVGGFLGSTLDSLSDPVQLGIGVATGGAGILGKGISAAAKIADIATNATRVGEISATAAKYTKGAIEGATIVGASAIPGIGAETYLRAQENQKDIYTKAIADLATQSAFGAGFGLFGKFFSKEKPSEAIARNPEKAVDIAKETVESSNKDLQEADSITNAHNDFVSSLKNHDEKFGSLKDEDILSNENYLDYSKSLSDIEEKKQKYNNLVNGSELEYNDKSISLKDQLSQELKNHNSLFSKVSDEELLSPKNIELYNKSRDKVNSLIKKANSETYVKQTKLNYINDLKKKIEKQIKSHSTKFDNVSDEELLSPKNLKSYTKSLDKLHALQKEYFDLKNKFKNEYQNRPLIDAISDRAIANKAMSDMLTDRPVDVRGNVAAALTKSPLLSDEHPPQMDELANITKYIGVDQEKVINDYKNENLPEEEPINTNKEKELEEVTNRNFEALPEEDRAEFKEESAENSKSILGQVFSCFFNPD